MSRKWSDGHCEPGVHLQLSCFFGARLCLTESCQALNRFDLQGAWCRRDEVCEVEPFRPGLCQCPDIPGITCDCPRPPRRCVPRRPILSTRSPGFVVFLLILFVSHQTMATEMDCGKFLVLPLEIVRGLCFAVEQKGRRNNLENRFGYL